MLVALCKTGNALNTACPIQCYTSSKDPGKGKVSADSVIAATPILAFISQENCIFSN